MSTLIMGILNATPDSFSDGGNHPTIAEAVARAHELARQGASIVDVGGESTRPGATPVPRDEEHARVIPVIRALAGTGITVSVDTIHAATARDAVLAGAAYINDVSGGTHDPEMLAVAAWASREHGARFIIGHWRGFPDANYANSEYADVVTEVCDLLRAQADAAVAAGVDRSRIVLDPGLGFDKTGPQCWLLLAELDRLRALGYPVLIGASRKRMLTEALADPAGPGLATVSTERDLATSVVTALAAHSGVWGVRVHDVQGSAQALAIVRAWEQAEAVAAVASRARSREIPRDRITLTGLEVFAHHGVFDFEREQGQRFFIDADIAVDLHVAAAGDELDRTVHYGILAEEIVAAVKRDPVDLIETVAERVADVALSFPAVAEARITVHKPDAPIEAPFADVSVSIVRGRK